MSSHGKYLDSGPTFWESKTTIQVENHRVKTFRITLFFLHHTATCMRKADEEKQAWRKVFGSFFCLKACLFPKDPRYTLRKGFIIYSRSRNRIGTFNPVVGRCLDS